MNPQEEFELRQALLKQEGIARRIAHPDWPAHKSSFDETVFGIPKNEQQDDPLTHVTYRATKYGLRRETVSEIMPINKIDGYRGYCKYCYSTHKNWWMMDQRDYDVFEPTPGGPVILCGNCEHTSLQEFVDRKGATYEAACKRFQEECNNEKQK